MKTTINFLSPVNLLYTLKTFAFFALVSLLVFSCDQENEAELTKPEITDPIVNLDTQDEELQTRSQYGEASFYIKLRGKANLGDSRDNCAGSGFCNVSFDRPYVNDDGPTIDIEIHISGMDSEGRFNVSKIVFPILPPAIVDEYFADGVFAVDSKFEKTVTINGLTGIIPIEEGIYVVYGDTQWFIIP